MGWRPQELFPTGLDRGHLCHPSGPKPNPTEIPPNDRLDLGKQQLPRGCMDWLPLGGVNFLEFSFSSRCFLITYKFIPTALTVFVIGRNANLFKIREYKLLITHPRFSIPSSCTMKASCLHVCLRMEILIST
jgi:hypothetical protein